MPREAHIERQVKWKNRLQQYGCQVKLEKSVYINNTRVVVDIVARAEGKTFWIEIGDISDKRKIALMEIYAKQNPNIEFIHEPYNTNKIGKVLANLEAYRNSDEFHQLTFAKMEKRKRKNQKDLVVVVFVCVIILVGAIMLRPTPENQNQTLIPDIPSENQNQTINPSVPSQNQTSGFGILSLPQNDDASIALNFPDKNYGSDDTLIVHYMPQSSGPSDGIPAARRNAYLNFNLSSVSGLAIRSATLKVFCSSVGYNGSTVGVHHSQGFNFWKEETIRGNNAPPYVSVASDSVLVMENNTWYSFDVTSDVIASLNFGTITEVLRIENTTGSTHDIRFWSKEYSDEQYHPRLEITPALP